MHNTEYLIHCLFILCLYIFLMSKGVYNILTEIQRDFFGLALCNKGRSVRFNGKL